MTINDQTDVYFPQVLVHFSWHVLLMIPITQLWQSISFKCCQYRTHAGTGIAELSLSPSLGFAQVPQLPISVTRINQIEDIYSQRKCVIDDTSATLMSFTPQPCYNGARGTVCLIGQWCFPRRLGRIKQLSAWNWLPTKESVYTRILVRLTRWGTALIPCLPQSWRWFWDSSPPGCF